LDGKLKKKREVEGTLHRPPNPPTDQTNISLRKGSVGGKMKVDAIQPAELERQGEEAIL